MRSAGNIPDYGVVQAAYDMDASLSRILNENANPVVVDDVPKLLLACMPKSGSTWFTTILERGLGLASRRCYVQPDRNEQEINPVSLFQNFSKRVLFVQQHVRASAVTMKLCRAFSVRIVVLTRRIDDAIVSFRDHMERESTIASMFYMRPEWFREFSREQQLDFLIDHCVPWYLNFCVGWIDAHRENPQSVLFVNYEEVVADPAGMVARVARFADMPYRIGPETLTLREGSRFNQGRAGRGKDELNARQQRRIQALAGYYRAADLSSVGLC